MELIAGNVCSPQAIELLGAAVVDKDRARLDARTYAQRRIDYLPYYHLARAHLACGNLQLARKYLSDSRSQGVAAATTLDALEQRIIALEDQQQEAEGPTVDPARLEARAQQVGQRLDAAEANLGQLERRLGRPEPAEALRRDTELASRLRAGLGSAAERLSAARARLATGRERSDPFVVADAATLSSDLARDLEEIAGELDQAVADLRDQRLRDQAAERLAAATPATSPADRIASAEAGRSQEVTPAPQAQTPAATPRAEQRPGPPGVRPLELLRQATRLYVGADYEAVLTQLEPARLDSDGINGARGRATAALLRAAARFALIRTMSERPPGGTELHPPGANEASDAAVQDLWDALQSDLGLCRRLAPDIRPDPSIFPPPFRDLFESTRR